MSWPDPFFHRSFHHMLIVRVIKLSCPRTSCPQLHKLSKRLLLECWNRISMSMREMAKLSGHLVIVGELASSWVWDRVGANCLLAAGVVRSLSIAIINGKLTIWHESCGAYASSAECASFSTWRALRGAVSIVNEAFGSWELTLVRIVLVKLMVKEGRCCGEKRGLIIECLASAELTSDRSCPTVVASRDNRCHNGLFQLSNSTASMR